MPEVVHFTGRRGLITPAGPLTVEIAGFDRVADPGRHIVGVADVQGLARAAEPGTELAAAQETRQPVRTRKQLDSLPDDVLLERLAAQPGRQRLRTRHRLTRAGRDRGTVARGAVVRGAVAGIGVVGVG